MSSEFRDTADRTRAVFEGPGSAFSWLEANDIDPEDFMRAMDDVAQASLGLLEDGEPALGVLRGALSHAAQIGYTVGRNRATPGAS